MKRKKRGPWLLYAAVHDLGSLDYFGMSITRTGVAGVMRYPSGARRALPGWRVERVRVSLAPVKPRKRKAKR